LKTDAERRASRIYASAGIQIVWINGPADPDVPNAARHLHVALLTRDMGATKAAADQLSDGVMGRAAKLSGTAVIFYFRITDMARTGRCFVGDFLGRVLAHEVGHLLLPRPGHSDRGLMEANLSPVAGEQSWFTTPEVNAMRGALTSQHVAD
jgi:hypothetical protein